MNLKQWSGQLSRISDIYTQRYQIQRNDDWYLLKIQEELGELTAAYLKCGQRARSGGQDVAVLERNLREELADVLAMTLLFAKNAGIDPEEALREKWLKYLPEKVNDQSSTH